MSTSTFTIQSVHGLKQTFVLGPTIELPPGQTESQSPQVSVASSTSDQRNPQQPNEIAPSNPR